MAHSESGLLAILPSLGKQIAVVAVSYRSLISDRYVIKRKYKVAINNTLTKYPFILYAARI